MESAHQIFTIRRGMTHKISEQSSNLIWISFQCPLLIVHNSDSEASENVTLPQNDANVQETNSAETNIPLDGSITTDPHPPPFPGPESNDSSKQQKHGKNIAFLCNPNDEVCKIHGHHILEFFSNDLDDIEKCKLAEECDCEQMLIMLTA